MKPCITYKSESLDQPKFTCWTQKGVFSGRHLQEEEEDDDDEGEPEVVQMHINSKTMKNNGL